MIAGEQVPRATEPSLNLVSDHQDIVLSAQFPYFPQVSLIGQDYPTFTLDRLQEHTGHVWVSLQHPLEIFAVIVLEQWEARGEGPELRVADRVITRARGCDGATPEVIGGEEDVGLVIGDSFHAVAPPTDQFHRGLICFDSAVHGDELVVAEEVRHVCRALAKRCVMESPRSQCDLRSLSHEVLENFGVHVSLVARANTRETVNEHTVVAVPNVDAFSPHDRQRLSRVELDSVLVVQIHVVLVAACREESSSEGGAWLSVFQ